MLHGIAQEPDLGVVLPEDDPEDEEEKDKPKVVISITTRCSCILPTSYTRKYIILLLLRTTLWELEKRRALPCTKGLGSFTT